MLLIAWARFRAPSAHPLETRPTPRPTPTLQSGRLRDECLNITVFWSLTQARVVISDWKQEHNHHRRHSALATRPRPVTLPPAPTH